MVFIANGIYLTVTCVTSDTFNVQMIVSKCNIFSSKVHWKCRWWLWHVRNVDVCLDTDILCVMDVDVQMTDCIKYMLVKEEEFIKYSSHAIVIGIIW